MPTEPATRGGTDTLDMNELLKVLRAFKKGDFSARMPLGLTGVAGKGATFYLAIPIREGGSTHEQTVAADPAGRG